MYLNYCLKFVIVALLSAFFNLRNVFCAEVNQTISKFDFGVIRAQNSSDDVIDEDYSSYFCLIDVLANSSSSENYNEEFLPLNNYLKNNNLCGSFSLKVASSKSNGYYLFQHSSTCTTVKQIENFATHFQHANGLIFSASCHLNLTTSFNLTSEFVSKQTFSISVITDSNVDRLISYKQVQRIKPEESKSSAISCMILIFSLAVFCVVVGSYWSGEVRFGFYLEAKRKSQRSALVQNEESSESKSEKLEKHHDAFAELTLGSVVFAVVVTIAVLLSLYFFYKYIVYFFIGIFMLFSAISLFACVHTILSKILPKSIASLSFSKSPFLCIKRLYIEYLTILLIPPSFAVPIVWFCIRHTSQDAWILQDILCVCFCIFQLRTLRLPSFKICFMLLAALFIYDIFFVFITPLFTSSGVSIMEYVATGGISNRGSISEYRCAGEKAEVLPLSIRAPRNIFGRDPRSPMDFCLSGGYSLLGLGDIIIPGIMVSYCNAFDLIRNVPYRPYFVASSFGYALGLVFSYIALITMEIAQPALLYLVPTTVISVLLVSLWRKELPQFWIGPEESCKLVEDSSSFEVES